MTALTPAALLRAKTRTQRARTEGTHSVNARHPRYGRSPALFAEEVLGVELAEYQREILDEVGKGGRFAVRSPHGAGKTTMAAIVILWAVTCLGGDTKVPMTAGVWRQVINFLAPEIHKWAARANWARAGITLRRGKELLELSIKMQNGATAFPLVSDNAELIEGVHAKNVVYIIDEAKAVRPAVWEAIEGAFSNEGLDPDGITIALAISTPGDTSGVFYNIHKRKPGYERWRTFHITLAQTIAAGRVSAAWAEDKRRQWGEDSQAYQNRVLAEFAEGGGSNLIPLAWLEAAQERWHERIGADGALTIGADPARFGDDKTTVARLRGRNFLERIDEYAKQSTMETAGVLMAQSAIDDLIAVDVIGIGAGVVDRLRELRRRVVSVNVSERTPLTDSTGLLHFVNLRAALWWGLREALDPEGSILLALPPDADLLIGDLGAPVWGYTSAGLIWIESKDDLRKRLGRSTDYADALAIALYAASHYATMTNAGNERIAFDARDW